MGEPDGAGGPADLEGLLLGLTRRLHPRARSLRASIAIDLGAAGSWGLLLDSGRAAVTASMPENPDLVIRTTPDVFRDIVCARRPGYEAFLDGELEVRGNLSLALQLDSLFVAPEPVAASWPVVFHVRAGKLRWSVLAAGPPDGPPVVLMHGLGGTKASFLPTVRGLSDTFRVIACDLPGFGASSKPIARYDAPWFAARALELLDALEIKEAGFVGNSMGGRIALELGMRSPERCRGLVLLCPALAFLRNRSAVPLVRLIRPELGMLPVRPTRGMVQRNIRDIVGDPERISQRWADAVTDEFRRIQSKPRGRHAFYAAARRIYLEEPHGEEGFWRRLARLDVPAQFVFGEQDPLIPAAFATHVEAALPDALITILPGGHVPQLEAPEETHRMVRALLA